MKILTKQKRWLLPAVLILFILEVITFPLVVSLTYAGKNESPEHILTYKTHSLTWDENTEVRENGSGELSLFSAVYQNVNSDNGEKVLAPGTTGDNLIRLLNTAENEIEYTAILYTVRSTGNLPAAARMNGAGEITDTYTLPDDVTKEAVVKALHGTLNKGEIADFEIDWYWIYEESMSQDEIDTALGNSAAKGDAEDILVGFYVVIEDEGEIITPDPSPELGENDMLYGFIALFVISLIVLIILFVKRRKE